jgi:2,4-dienoyl-CoA reductase-like NADH-dependent reductase (Old Yellow Enzyme family)
VNYHQAVAEGGIGMTTVAYAAVSKSGLSFAHQLWLMEDAVHGLRILTGSVHNAGAAAAIQIGHCGQMAKKAVSGDCMSPSGGFNLYGPTWPRPMNKKDIREVVTDFGHAVNLARKSGFEFIQMARALIHDPAFINKLKTGELKVSGCNHTNYCIAVMYSGKMACCQNEKSIPEALRKELES